MISIVFGIYIFFDIIGLLVFFDIILSWLTFLGIKFRPQFMVDVIDPIYNFIKKYIPTTIGFFDFTPVIVIFGLSFFKGLIIIYFPRISNIIENYLNLIYTYLLNSGFII